MILEESDTTSGGRSSCRYRGASVNTWRQMEDAIIDADKIFLYYRIVFLSICLLISFIAFF